MNTLLQDIRYALRLLAKSPGFTAIVVLTLALGIGANTAIFSAVNGILLKPLPYPSFSRLVHIANEKTSGGAGMLTQLSTATALEIQKQCTVFEGLVTYAFGGSYTLTGQSAPEFLSGTSVSGNFFTFFGVRPLLGRSIVPSDTTPGNSDVVVLGYNVWNSLLGGDPHWIGRKILLSGKWYRVIGVMPKKFDMGINPKHGIWLPRVPVPGDATDRQARFMDVMARLKPGITIAAVQAQLKTVGERLAATYPKTDGGWTLLAQNIFATDSDVQRGLLLLLGAAGFVLLIACVNVSGLLLARGWARQRELAIREALGASRLRIIRQFLSESILLAFAGGAVALFLSVWAIRVIRLLAQPYTSSVDDIQLNSNVLWFTFGVALFAGVLFGLAPALRVSARRNGKPLMENLSSAEGSSGRRSRKLRGALVVVEVALAVILVIGATLVGRSFREITSQNLGFRTDHILTMGINFSKPVCDPDSKNDAEQCQLAVESILAHVNSLQGIESAAVASGIPTRGVNVGEDLQINDQKEKIGFSEGSLFFERTVSPGFFQTMGMRVLQGRDFTNDDTVGAQGAVIVNQIFAKKFLSNLPLGKRMSQTKSGQPEWMVIIGEVNDTRDFSIEGSAMPEIYVPYGRGKNKLAAPDLIVRTARDPMAMAAAVKQQVWSVDKNAPITGLATMDQIISDEVAEPKFQALLLGSFGAFGLVLAMVGIYGVISYGVTQRTHEIGIRLALGAHPANVLGMVICEGMILAGAGIVLGVAGALALGRVLESVLFEIKPTDPATFVSVAILLALVSAAACYIPARRAMRVEPMEALRYE